MQPNRPTLRDDQAAVVADLRAALLTHQSVLVRAECGWGKTLLAAEIALGAQRKNKRVIFAVHRKELLRQTARTFDSFGIRYGYIAGGLMADPFAHVQIATRQTLAARDRMLRCDLFIPDEAHLWCSKTAMAIIAEVKAHGAKVIPLTATPALGNGDGLGAIADAIVHGPSASWLIERVLLARYRAFGPVSPDMSKIKVRAGEYADLDPEFDKPSVVGDRVAAYKQFARGKRMVGYCYSRQNGEHTADAFNSAGVRAVFIDGEDKDDYRRDQIGKFADGDIDVLLNCQLLGEGFDLSAQVGRRVPIQAVGLYTPMKSLPRAIQQIMRPMRPQDDAAILLDHVNLLREHGFPDDERQWPLTVADHAARKSEQTVFARVCGACMASFRPGPLRCPECKAVLEIKPRTVDEVAGELAELDREAIERAAKMEKSRERGMAKTLPELAKVAKRHGYKAGWILNMADIRGINPKPTYQQAVDAMRRAG